MINIDYKNKLINSYEKAVKRSSNKDRYFHVMIIVDHEEWGAGQVYPFYQKDILENSEMDDTLDLEIEKIHKNEKINKAELFYFRKFYTGDDLRFFKQPHNILYKKTIIK